MAKKALPCIYQLVHEGVIKAKRSQQERNILDKICSQVQNGDEKLCCELGEIVTTYIHEEKIAITTRCDVNRFLLH